MYIERKNVETINMLGYADSDTLTFKLINNLELDIRIEEVL